MLGAYPNLYLTIMIMNVLRVGIAIRRPMQRSPTKPIASEMKVGLNQITINDIFHAHLSVEARIVYMEESLTVDRVNVPSKHPLFRPKNPPQHRIQPSFRI
jgi:hypothetical protein